MVCCAKALTGAHINSVAIESPKDTVKGNKTRGNLKLILFMTQKTPLDSLERNSL
jgi:hypothetical protein